MRSAAVWILLAAADLGFGSAAIAQTNVLTQHNDMGRTGLNSTETILTPANVNVNTFGKLYSIPIDGQAFAQPLYMSSLPINGVSHSVLFVATEHDSVFAFDTNAQGAVLWQASLSSTAYGAAAGATSDPLSTTGCIDIQGKEYGITGTPVIDAATNTLYTMSRTLENGHVVQRLHALDVTTGNEKFGGPATIAATVAGTGYDSVNGLVTFNPEWENPRPGLLLLNGTVYIAWGSVCDDSYWHGWVMGYSAATGTLTQTTVFITSPNGAESGIWMSGAGLAADTENGVSRIFVATGNGSYDAAPPYGTNTMDYGDTILALTPSVSGALKVTDEFTPYYQAALAAQDEDFGAGGVVVLPDNLPGAAHAHLGLEFDKPGTMFLFNRDNVGGYSTSVDNDLQEVNFASGGYGLRGIPAYWNGNVYFWPADSNLKQYTITNGLLSTTPVAQATPTEANSGHLFWGTTVSVSSNANNNPIVWADDWVLYSPGSPGGPQNSPIQYFYAFDGTNVGNLLWSSAQNPGRDGAGAAQKYAVPTIADGHVYVASQGYIQVYGLLPPGFTIGAAQSAVSIPPTSSANIPIPVNEYGGLSGTVALTASGLPSGVTASFANGVLTLSAAATAPPTSGGAVVTVTGTYGTLTHSVSILLNVTSAPYDVPTGLANSSNVYASQTTGTSPANGGFDGAGDAYSATLLGSSITANGIVYTLGAPGVADGVTSATISIPSTAGAVGPLNVLAAASNGTQGNQIFTLHYSDGSTSTFTQSISDWGSPQNYPGETIALSMAYRIIPGGTTQNGPFYLYSYSVPLTPGKVLTGVTLPNNRSVVVMAVTLGPSTASTAQTIVFSTIAQQTVHTPVPLAATTNSGLAVYFTSSTPSVCTVAASTATLLAAGTCTITAAQAGNNSYAAASSVSQSFSVVSSATAQTIAFSAIPTQTVGAPLTLNAMATSGLAVSFASSTASVCTISNSTANFLIAGTCTITATQAGNGSYGAASPVTQNFTVTQSTAGATGSVSLASVDNVYALANSGKAPVNGGMDGSGYAYPASLLGTTVTWSGSTFSLGTAAAASAIANATVALPSGSYTTLQILAAAAYGPFVNQVFTVNYTDGSTSRFTQSVSDWGHPQKYSGESIAATTASRVTPTGALQNIPFYVYGYAFSLNSAKTVKSVALPANRNVVVLAIDVVQGSSTTAAAQTISFNSVSAQSVGVPLVLGATASSGLPVAYASSTPSICTVTGGTATFVNPGTCTVTASQAGNTSYAAASSVSQSFTVQAAAAAGGYDVVLLIGQSNMVGLGTGADDAGDAAADPRIFQWNSSSGAIVPASDPLNQNSPPYNIGLGLTFAKAYVKHMAPNRKLLLVGAATGDTGFVGGYWLTPNGAGVTTALSWVNAALAAAGSNAHLVGILWHQGENDIGYSGGSAYQGNLQNLISYFRSNITGATSATPFIAGEMVNAWLTYNLSNSTDVSQQNIILNDIHTLPDTVAYTAWTSGAELTSDPYYSTIHFSALSQRQLGRRYADKFFEASNNLPQPQVSQKWWAGTFYDDGRGLGSANTNSIPVNNPATVSGTVTEVIDPARGNVAKVSQGQGWLSYQVPATTFNGSYTKMAWFLPGASGYGNNLISANNAGQVHYFFAQNTGNNQLFIGAGHSSGAVTLGVSATVTNPVGTWMNLALAYDANAKTMTLYLNGTVIATQSGIAAAPAPTASTPLPVLLGSYGSTGSTAMDGEIAGGRVWNTALTAAQISAIYNYETVGTGNEPGFGIVVGAPSQASNSPAAPGIPYHVPAFVAAAGGTASSLPVAIVPNNGFVGTPGVAMTGLPAGATYTLSPTQTANNYTLQITGVPTTSAVGAYPLVVTGTSSTATAEAAANLCLSVPDGSGYLHVGLSCFFNRVDALVTDGTSFSGGGMDGSGDALSATLLGGTVTSGNVQFTLGAPNGFNGVSSASITLPQGQYSTLGFLAVGVNGAQAAQTFTVTYTDGTTSTFTQSVSDWGAPQNYSGEATAATMAYRDAGNGTQQAATFHLYGYSLALNSAKTVASITLPNNPNVIVMAMTVK